MLTALTQTSEPGNCMAAEMCLRKNLHNVVRLPIVCLPSMEPAYQVFRERDYRPLFPRMLAAPAPLRRRLNTGWPDSGSLRRAPSFLRTMH
jgi:hypothetical protein